jgi:hypothetical protein
MQPEVEQPSSMLGRILQNPPDAFSGFGVGEIKIAAFRDLSAFYMVPKGCVE